MINREFWIPIVPGRLTQQHLGALDVTARLVFWLSATAHPQTGTWFIELSEFATWAGCSHTQARRGLDELEATGWVVEVERHSRGQSGKLGAMFKLQGDPELTAAARVYQHVVGARAQSDERRQMCVIVGTNAKALKVWHEVCTKWVTERRNASDIGGMLRAFEKANSRTSAPSAVTEANYEGYKSEGGGNESGE